MLVDAIILTGGRSSRLNSVPKSEFVVDGVTLLDRTLSAASIARHVVVVGSEPAEGLPKRVVLVREEPPFSGPVAAIAAGMVALRSVTNDSLEAASRLASDALLVLACDMPHIGLAVPSLLHAFENSHGADGVIAVDNGGRRQPLAAVYRTSALAAALNAVSGSAPHSAADGADGVDPLAGLPMFGLLDHMTLVAVEVPHDATADVDTWDDAVKLGAHPPATSTTHSTPI